MFKKGELEAGKWLFKCCVVLLPVVPSTVDRFLGGSRKVKKATRSRNQDKLDVGLLDLHDVVLSAIACCFMVGRP
jgi:hypothetical protein